MIVEKSEMSLNEKMATTKISYINTVMAYRLTKAGAQCVIKQCEQVNMLHLCQQSPCNR